MAKGVLGSADCATFFRSVATMLSVGVQADEAVFMVADSDEDDALKAAALGVYRSLLEGSHLSTAMRDAGCFPDQAVTLVESGEETGRLDDTLNSLAEYYDEETRLMLKVRSSVVYPCVLLCILSVIMAFTVGAIIPVFEGVYEGMVGSLAASSFSAIDVGIAIGWVALGATLLVTLLALVAFVASRTNGGRRGLLGLGQKMPFARRAFYDLSLSRFTASLAAFTAAGQNTDDAVGHALQTVDNKALRVKVSRAYKSMASTSPANSLVQAFAAHGVFDGQQLRMLAFGLKTGSMDGVLQRMSGELFDEAVDGMDAMLDKVEPILSGFVTVAVGVTLIAVMLPLVGMMGAIG